MRVLLCVPLMLLVIFLWYLSEFIGWITGKIIKLTDYCLGEIE